MTKMIYDASLRLQLNIFFTDFLNSNVQICTSELYTGIFFTIHFEARRAEYGIFQGRNDDSCALYSHIRF